MLFLQQEQPTTSNQHTNAQALIRQSHDNRPLSTYIRPYMSVAYLLLILLPRTTTVCTCVRTRLLPFRADRWRTLPPHTQRTQHKSKRTQQMLAHSAAALKHTLRVVLAHKCASAYKHSQRSLKLALTHLCACFAIARCI